MQIRKGLLFLGAAALALPMFAGPMKAGKWSMTIQTEMPGMPMKMPPVTVETCVTPEQAEHPEPPKQRANSDCKISDYKLDGNTVTWKMVCAKQNMTGDGKITYSGESYTGEMHMLMGEHEMSAKYTGKRVGDCDK